MLQLCGVSRAIAASTLRVVRIDLADLSHRWQQSWPQCPPIASLFKTCLHDRWVRFHSLPGSQRYATTEAEYDTILYRHNTILGELRATDVYVITVQYEPDDLAAGTEPVNTGLHPNASPWMRAADPDDAEMVYDLHVSALRYEPGELDDLLRYVAGDRAPGVVITDVALQWLYHLYDGGADVILPSSTARDRLKARHGVWLSARPDGL